MITITRTTVTEFKVSEKQFAQWIKDTIHNVGYDEEGMATVDDVKLYLKEDDSIDDYSEDFCYCGGPQNTTIEGISDKKIAKILAKKIAEIKAEEEEEEEE